MVQLGGEVFRLSYFAFLVTATLAAGASVGGILAFQKENGSAFGLVGAAELVAALEEAAAAAEALTGGMVLSTLLKRVGEGVEVCTRVLPEVDLAGVRLGLISLRAAVAEASLEEEVALAVAMEEEEEAAAEEVVAFAVDAGVLTADLAGAGETALEGEEVVAERPIDAKRVRPEAEVPAVVLGIELVSLALVSFVGVLGAGSHLRRRSFTLRWPVVLVSAEAVVEEAAEEGAEEDADAVCRLEALEEGEVPFGVLPALPVAAPALAVKWVGGG